MEHLNQSFFLLFNGITHKNQFVDLFFIFSAEYLPYIIIISVVLYVYFHKDRYQGIREVAVIALSVGTAYVFASVFKHFYVHDRPFLCFTDVHPLISPDSPHGSFPSGHSTFFSALGLAFYYYHPKLGVLYLLGALLIGLSRIVVGVHWPLDILGGYIVGGVIALLVHFIVEKSRVFASLEAILPKGK